MDRYRIINMRKIVIVTGSRGEYGYIRPLIKEIQKDKNLECSIIATNMHLLGEFGYSLEEFEKDGIKVSEKIYNTFDGYTNLTMVKSLGVFLMQLPESIDRLKPDIILCAGDRGENMVVAMTGAYMYIPVAHIQAGELSGNIDGTTRHAITKFAHLHFCANGEFAERVEKMGEEKFRIFDTGAPQLDELVSGEITSQDELIKKYNLDIKKPIFLLVQHPVTEEYGNEVENVSKVMEAVNKFDDAQVLCILPNSDAGNKEVKSVIEKKRSVNFKIFRNIPRQDYAGLMKIADVIVGNSSSAIIEAPIFKLPAVNIGQRQQNRTQAKNVINVSYDTVAIEKAIKTALSAEFKAKISNCSTPYGDGQSSKRIIKILKEVEINDRLIHKKLTY